MITFKVQIFLDHLRIKKIFYQRLLLLKYLQNTYFERKTL